MNIINGWCIETRWLSDLDAEQRVSIDDRLVWSFASCSVRLHRRFTSAPTSNMEVTKAAVDIDFLDIHYSYTP